MNKHVVISGIGVVSPIGSNIEDFKKSLINGVCGIKSNKKMEDLDFVCKISGIPVNFPHNEIALKKYLPERCDSAIRFLISAGLDAWNDAGFEIPEFYSDETNDEIGIAIGSSCCGYDYFSEVKNLIDNKQIRRLGSWFTVNTMHSGPATFLANILAVSNIVLSNSSACASGCESIISAYKEIKNGNAKVMIAGGCDPDTPYVWAGFDAMRILCRDGNENPKTASRPLSELANGFVPSSGAGVLILEELEHARSRKAKIYAEIVGSGLNSGGQRNGGSMTFPNSVKTIECIKRALDEANISGDKIDYINGHLTGTTADYIEIKNWCDALKIDSNFPFINSTKSMIGHTLGAAGAIETIATILQMKNNFIHESLNCNPINKKIKEIYDTEKIPQKCIKNQKINYAAKAGFGFGDINACLILKNWNELQ